MFDEIIFAKEDWNMAIDYFSDALNLYYDLNDDSTLKEELGTELTEFADTAKEQIKSIYANYREEMENE